MAVILVTGAVGFIARHVIDLLKSQGHSVLGVDSLDKRVHLGGVPPWFIDPLAICNYAETPAHFLEQADYVVHLAAQVSVADSAVDPLRYIHQNTRDTAHFLQRLSQRPIPLVVASSMSVYGEGGVHVREFDPVCPTSVYGLTKYDQERLCLMWGEQHKVPTVALRFFNVYGPGQALHNGYTGVLANFANKLLADEAPQVYEDGLQTRDFVNVKDVARAVNLATFSGNSGAYNVCTGDATTVLGAAEELAKALNPGIKPVVTGTERPGDIRHCTGDPRKATVGLGFTAKIPFVQGIAEYASTLRQP